MLRKLCLTDFRNYSSHEWCFDSRITLFIGPNGAGKSNLLEAIFFLGLLRSFRTNRLRELIRIGSRRATIEADLDSGAWCEKYRIDYELDGKRHLSIDEIPVPRASEFIRGIQPVIFAPEDRALVTGSAPMRRRFFDMLIAMIEPEYFTALAHYNAALLRRNAALRSGSEAVARAFEPQMAECAAIIRKERAKYAADIAAAVQKRLSGTDFNLLYTPDYPESAAEYRMHFEKMRQREKRTGFTVFGPQLDDVEIRFQERSARAFASTGQGRKLAILLKLAALEVLRERTPGNRKGKVLILVDDVTGDLDAENRASFLREIDGADQLFFTFTAPPADDFFQNSTSIVVG